MYLVLLHLQPKEHPVFQEVPLEGHKVLKLLAGDRVEQCLAESQDLFGSRHPSTVREL